MHSKVCSGKEVLKTSSWCASWPWSVPAASSSTTAALAAAAEGNTLDLNFAMDPDATLVANVCLCTAQTVSSRRALVLPGRVKCYGPWHNIAQKIETADIVHHTLIS